MVELMQIAAAAAVGTAAIVVALLPRRWPLATVVAALLIPLLIFAASMIASRIAYAGLSGETGNAVGELDLWLLAVLAYEVTAAVLCIGRVAVWAREIAASPSGRLLNR